MRGQCFRLKSATMGIFSEKETTLVPSGAVITVLSEPDAKFVYVLQEGRRIRMFVQDIQERGTPVLNEPMPTMQD